MEKISILSPAKLNLTLKVAEKIDNGYHKIDSVVQIINFFDEIQLSKSSKDREIIFNFSDSSVKKNENLAFIAIESFINFFQIKEGIKVDIKKNIPMGAGLGGGSRNAAAVLIGLHKLFKLNNFDQLVKLGAKIGSDIPLFLYGRSANLSGRGEIVETIKNPFNLNYLLIIPQIHSSTEELYSEWDKNQEAVSQYFQNKDTKLNIKDHIIELRNDFLPLLIKKFVIYDEIFSILKDFGLSNISISGTGSSIFAIINNSYDCEPIIDYFKSSNQLKVFQVQSIEGWQLQID